MISLKAVIEKDEKLLILQLPNRKTWDIPGGMIDYNEDKVKGLAREVREETGLEVGDFQLLEVSDFRRKNFTLKDGRVCDPRVFVVSYLCRVSSGSLRLSVEHGAYLWASFDDLRKLEFHPVSQPAIDRFLSKKENE